MKLGSLFSGAGLGDLGWLMAGFDIRWQVEIDPYCRKVLALRYPESKKYHDIKTLKGCEVEPVDIVAGGFPCQPFSVAGKQRGDQDNRNLWPEMLRVIKEVRPTWVVGENVSGLIPIYLDTVLSDLEANGYATRTFVFPAHALGASHRRERIWVVGYAEHNGRVAAEKRRSIASGSDNSKARKDEAGEFEGSGWEYETMADTGLLGQTEHEKQAAGVKQCGKDVADATKPGLERKARAGLQGDSGGFTDSGFWREFWSTEPEVGRVVNGCPSRVDRLKALGNGQVVACTAFIGQQIMEFERLTRYSPGAI